MVTGTLPDEVTQACAVLEQVHAVSNAQTQWVIEQRVSNLNFLHLSSSGASNRALYAQDFYAWTQTTAERIRAGQWYDLDREALAEEVESLGKSEQRELSNRLSILLEHLLKLAIAASRFPHDLRRAERGWRATVKTQRLSVAQVLRDNRSLRATVPHALTDAYEVARVNAAAGLDIEEDTVPETCPWMEAEVLNPNFWPEGEPTP